MDRFNQGFGGFGPMEQCADGKWVKYEEAEKTIDDLMELISLKDEYICLAQDDEEYLKEAYDENRFRLIVFCFLALAGWLSFGFLVLIEKGII